MRLPRAVALPSGVALPAAFAATFAFAFTVACTVSTAPAHAELLRIEVTPHRDSGIPRTLDAVRARLEGQGWRVSQLHEEESDMPVMSTGPSIHVRILVFEIDVGGERVEGGILIFQRAEDGARMLQGIRGMVDEGYFVHVGDLVVGIDDDVERDTARLVLDALTR